MNIQEIIQCTARCITTNMEEELTKLLEECNMPNDNPVYKITLSYPADDTWRTWVSTMLGLATLTDEAHPSDKTTLSFIYESMRRIYGFVPEQAIREYKVKYEISGRRISVLEVIESDAQWKPIFSAMLIDVVHNHARETKAAVSADIKTLLHKPTKSSATRVKEVAKKAAQETAKRSITTDLSKREDRARSIIEPLALKRKDTSLRWNATFRLVYKSMGVNWKHRITRYKNKRHIHYEPKKLEVVCGSDELLKMFEAQVRELLRVEEGKTAC